MTAVPLGVPIDRVEQSLSSRYRELGFAGRSLRFRDYAPPEQEEPQRSFGIADVQDESSMRVGVRLVVRLSPGSDAAEAEQWVRSVWPVTVEVDCRLPAPMTRRLRTWDAGDGSGLSALADLLG